MSKRILLPFTALALTIVAGCGGSNSNDDDNNGGGGLPIPTGTVRFSNASPDYSGGSTDLVANSGTILSDGTTYSVSIDNSSRKLYIAFPAASATPGTTLTFNGSVTGAVATYSIPVGGTLDTSRWEAKAGTVTLVSKTSTQALFRLTGLYFTPVTGSTGAQGTFTLNGTIVGTPIQN